MARYSAATAALAKAARPLSALPVGAQVDSSALGVSGAFDAGGDPQATALGILGPEARRRLEGVALADSVDVPGGQWSQAMIHDVPVYKNGLLVGTRGDEIEHVVLRIRRRPRLPAPPGNVDRDAAIEYVKRTRHLPEDLEDPSVPDPKLVWFDPGSVYPGDRRPAQQAWLFEFNGDRCGDVLVSADGTRTLAVIGGTCDNPDNPYQYQTTPQYMLDPVTGVPRFVSFRPELRLSAWGGGSSIVVARQFFHAFPWMFGTGAPDVQLRLAADVGDMDGGHHVSFDQYHGGVPVHGCRLIVHMTDTMAITSVSGRFFREPDVDLDPKLGEGEAYGLAQTDWILSADGDTMPPGASIESRGLTILPWRLVESGGENSLTWWFRYPDFDRFISAHTGAIVARLPRRMDARRVYDMQAANSGGAGTLQLVDGVLQANAGTEDLEARPAEQGNADVEAFWRIFGRNSWDDAGANFDSFVEVTIPPPSGPNNAWWLSGDSRVEYSRGFAEADVVAHEWTHALTEKTAGLVYLLEPGALNESLSDVFGKLIQPAPDPWIIGATAMPPGRDLENPTVDNYANFLVSPVTQAGDWGGVHTNSGIGNRAAVLISDGLGVPRARRGMGRERLTRIWWDILTTRLTPWSTYQDLVANAWQVTVELWEKGAHGIALPGTGGAPPAFAQADPQHVLWSFANVGIRRDLLTGWFSVPNNDTTDFIWFEGQQTDPNETVSDVLVRVHRIQGDTTLAFLGLLQVTTNVLTGTYAGGSVTATLTGHGQNTHSKEVRTRVTTQNFADVEASAEVVTTGVIGPPPNLEYKQPQIHHWFDNPLFLGRRYGDIVYPGATLNPQAAITDIEIRLVDDRGRTLARTWPGGAPAMDGGRGVWIKEAPTLPGNDLELRVRSWHDFGWSVRYRVIYWVTGNQVRFPTWKYKEVNPDTWK